MAKKATQKKQTKVIKKAAKKTVIKKASLKKNNVKKAVIKKTVVKKATAKKSNVIQKKKQKTVLKKTVKKITKQVTSKASNKKNAKKVILPNVKLGLTQTKKIVEKLLPLGERVLVRLQQQERVTSGGIILPDTVSFKEGYLQGQVVAVGSGTYSKKGHHKLLDVKPGDMVMFSDYAGTKIEHNGEHLYLVNESDILGVAQ